MAGEKRYQFAFSGKEIFVIVSMLLFIAVLVFTLGMMFGKAGGFNLSALKSLQSKTSLTDGLEEEDFLNDDVSNDELTEEDLNGEDALNEDLNDFEEMDKKAEIKSKAEPKKTEKVKQVKKTEEKKTEKLSFYEDLTQNDRKEDKLPSNTKRRYPMISEEVLLNNRGKYTVQVAAYAKEADAESKTLLLKKTCCPGAFYVMNEVKNKGVWYQVRIGFFDKLKNAKAFAQKLKAQRKIAEYVIKIVR